MSARALILTYHAIEPGPGPLRIDPATFAGHLDCILSSGARVVTVSELADALLRGALEESMVAITFDDGYASVARAAAPVLAERSLRATVFCVAGRLGGESDWLSAPPGSPRLSLMGASELAELAQLGFEIGSHGMEHEPLVGVPEPALRRELVDSRLRLEQELGVLVRSFAYPYGAGPSAAARSLVEETYTAACATTPAMVTARSDVYALPRVDVHYLRRPAFLHQALAGSLRPYLRARRLAARARRTLVKDYV